jgi:ATP-dependent RNA helicase DeaD
MKSGVRRLAAELSRRVRGVMGMQGDLPQSQRNKVMAALRDGTIRILVATDVVGRGIDVRGISHVVNYDLPEDPEQYVHRIGRTGRMGRDGKAFSLVTPDQGQLLTNIELFINKEVPRDHIAGFVSYRPRRDAHGRRLAKSEEPTPEPQNDVA